MGYSFDYVPVQLTRAFRKAQSDEKFQGWLKMQEAVMGIEFPIYDLPEIRDTMYTKESLETVEAKLMELYPDYRTAFSHENIHVTMRYVYYVGETFRRAIEGVWVAIPQVVESGEPPRKAAVDFPMREAYIEPGELAQMALGRRKGDEISRVYGYAERDYAEWVEAGRPERTYLGSLREGE